MEEQPKETQSPQKPHKCTFEGCNARFSRPYRLAQHLLHHYNIKSYKCNEDGCSRSYTSRSHLERHINNSHRNYQADEIIYSCPTCLKKFSNRQNLKRHILQLHKLKVTFICDICKEEYHKKHQLNAHMYQHTGIKAFSCVLCSKSFITLLEKKRHMRCHKYYECAKPQCHLVFHQWSKYQKHLKEKHNQPGEYACGTCGRLFKQKNHMTRHIKIHTEGEGRTYKCPYENCKRLYSRNSNLKQHILMKHEGVTHDCTICDAKLCTKAKLIQHVKKVHIDKPKPKTPKTRATGRKPRKDIGVVRVSTALKLSGLPKPNNGDGSENVIDISSCLKVEIN